MYILYFLQVWICDVFLSLAQSFLLPEFLDMSQHNICCQFNLRALYYLLLRLDEQAISLSVHMGASIYILAWDV